MGCHYVGLDICQAELELAPEGSYDETWVSDVTERVPDLENRFDLIVSWQVLEHVRSLDSALANMHAYLHPAGRMVAQLSGRFSVFGLINSIIPQRFGVWAMHRLLRRDRDTVLPAYYDQCSFDSLERLLMPWTEHEIHPRYNGAGYFRFSLILQKVYLRYEEWVSLGIRRNLATHYIISAAR